MSGRCAFGGNVDASQYRNLRTDKTVSTKGLVMTGFSVYSLIRNCLPGKHSRAGDDRANYQRLSAPDPTCAMFKDALDNSFDGVVPRSPRAKSRLAKVSNALSEKLKPKRLQRSSESSTTRNGANVATGFSNIFSRPAPKSPSSPYSLSLNTGQTVTRSRQEVERHVLLQSYLRSAYGDPAIRESEVLSVEEVLHPLQRPPRSHDRTPPSTPRADPTQAPPREARRSAEAIIETPPSPPPEVRDPPAPYLGESAQPETASNASSPGWAASWDFLSEQPAYNPPRSDTDLSPEQQSRQPSLSAMSNLSSVGALQPQPLAANVAASTLPADGYTPAQSQMIQFIEDRLELTQLDFFEDVAKRDPIVAAFFAVQTAKMTTSTDSTPRGDNQWGPTRHPHVNLKYPGLDIGVHGHRVRFDDLSQRDNNNLDALDRSDLLPALLKDLKAEIQRQNRVIPSVERRLALLNGAILPLGVTNSDSSANSFTQATTKRRLPALLGELANQSAGDHVKTLEQIAITNPNVAAAFGLVDNLLSIQGPYPDERCERYNHAGAVESAAEFPNFHENRGWLETFIPGIQRRPGKNAEQADAYRIKVAGQWQNGCSRANIFGTVIGDALRHLQTNGKTTDEQSIYPLAVYELVAEAVGIPVPPYLIEHEHEVLSQVEANRAKRNQNAERISELQRATAEGRAHTDAARPQLLFDAKVTSRHHLHCLDRNLDDNKIKARSIEGAFSLTPKHGNPLDFIRHLQANYLEKSHIRQAIATRPAPGVNPDNHCWLRSSWIPILIAGAPDVLADQYLQMHQNPAEVQIAEAKKIRDIAQQFKQDPSAFLHADGAGESWLNQTGRPARLGREILTDQLVKNPAKGDPVNEAPEQFLKRIQISIAAAFRSFENPSLMRELSTLDFPGTPASSDLPILLNRAFKVPLLIIETGRSTQDAAGNPSTMAPQIRVAAPAGSDLAKLISDAAVENTPLDENSEFFKKIMVEFSDLPIVWMERGHFDVYIPNSQFSK